MSKKSKNMYSHSLTFLVQSPCYNPSSYTTRVIDNTNYTLSCEKYNELVSEFDNGMYQLINHSVFVK